MRKLLLLCLLLLTGCQNVVGPLGYRRPLRVDDPNYSIPEQEVRGRDRLALPDIKNQYDPGNEILPRTMTQFQP
jgi:hypothetical protein